MLIAINKNGKRFNALDLLDTDTKQKYICPACQSDLILKKGKIKCPHFAHRSLNECHSWSENESSQHLSLKIQFYKWFGLTEKVALEYYLPDLKQTPDLLVNDKIAIEIQCSTLSLERLIERTENYRKHGFYVIWLMGKNLWLKKSATTLQENLMYFSENRGFYYWELDEGRKKIRLKSLIHQDIKGQLYFKMEEYDFFSGDLLALLRLPMQAQKMQTVTLPNSINWKNWQSHFVQQQLMHRSKKWLALQFQYYESQQTIMASDFSKAHVAPVGCDLFSWGVNKPNIKKFAQIDLDLTTYYQNFYGSFRVNRHRKLYPPHFYDIMKDKQNR